MTPTVELYTEPQVVCKSTEATDCKQGLLTGPHAARNPGHSNVISLGVIGTYNLIDNVKSWIDAANEHIVSELPPPPHAQDERARKKHKLLFPDFPGAPVAFEKTLVAEQRFERKITLEEIAALDKTNKYGFIDKLLDNIESKLASILETADRKPDVVLVLLTDEIYDICHLGNL